MTFVGDDILRVKPMLPNEWLVVILLAATIIPIDLFKKWILHKTGKKVII
jgi:hypothetical protein